MHEPCPTDGCCCPAGQVVHTVAAAPEYWPAAQPMQADDELEPTCGLYFPAVQLSQELAPPPATRTLPVRMSLVESQNVKR